MIDEVVGGGRNGLKGDVGLLSFSPVQPYELTNSSTSQRSMIIQADLTKQLWSWVFGE